MKFDFFRARNVVKGLLMAAAIMCVVAFVTTGEYKSISAIFGYTAIGTMILTFAIIFFALRCPYCDARILRRAITIKVCPHCRRNLVSGMKVKRKSIK